MQLVPAVTVDAEAPLPPDQPLMAVIETQTIVTSTVWVCDFCGRGAEHKAGTGSCLSAEYFIDRLRWIALNDTTIACDRCRLQPDIAHRAFTDHDVCLV